MRKVDQESEALKASGATPLTIAAARGDEKEVRRLIAEGAPVDEEDEVGRTALKVAVEEGWVESARALLEAGAKLSGRAVRDYALMAAAARNGDERMLDLLLKWKADVRGVNPGLRGMSAGHVAIANGREGALKVLLRAGLSPNQATAQGVTLLMEAARRGHQECVRILLREGARLEEKDASGMSAALHAASKGHRGCLEELARAGCELGDENAPWGALRVAEDFGHKDLAGWIRSWLEKKSLEAQSERGNETQRGPGASRL